jgi:hypothetical protein
MKHVMILKKNAKNGFYFLSGINREIIPSHVSVISESIEFIGAVTRPVIVVKISFLPGGTKYYIIDGQHLYLACIRLECDIPYIVLDSSKIKDIPSLIETIALLNTTSKSWRLLDYIHTWAYYKPNYKTFLDLYNKYNLAPGTLGELLHTGIVTAKYNSASLSVLRDIKEGKLRIVNLTMAKEVLSYVADLRSVTKDLGRIKQNLIISIIIEKIKADGRNYNHKAFKKHIIKNKHNMLIAYHDINNIRDMLKK